jgi:hypothetical protein
MCVGKPPPETLDELRRQLAQEQPGSDPALFRLSFAAVEAEEIELLLKTEQGDVMLATAQSSGAPPYTGIFSVTLNPEQQELVIAALHQRAGILRVRYHATRSTQVTANITLGGDVQAAWAELDAESTLDDCRQWVIDAFAGQVLQQTRTGSPLTPPALWQRAEAELLELAAQWLHQHLPRAPRQAANLGSSRAFTAQASNLSVTVTLTDRLDIPLTRTADVSNWFTGGEADDHVRVIG